MNSSSASIIATGNAGLDQVLRGGLPKDRLYLLEGTPGSGKTTLGLQFLFEGVRQGESVLYITLSETSEELRCVAESHGWSLDGVELFELSAADAVLGGAQEQTILHPWESELGDTIELIQARVDELQPRRLVFDSLSEMRLLAQDPLRYRRQVLALKQFFAGRGITVLLVDDLTASGGERDNHLHSLCHGVLTLERLTLDFGAARRRLQIQKLRGVDFIAGYHDFVLRRGGLEIYPRMIAAGRYQDFVGQPVPSNIADMDALLHGGPLRGTSTLITGPAGTGKTTLALQYVTAACARGERCAVYEFDERIGTLLKRAESMGMPLHRYIDEGLLVVHQIDPAELSPGEFAWRVRQDVEENDCRMLVLDSLNGYLAAMPQEQQLILQLHELLSYLSQSGVVTFLINPQHGLVGSMTSNLDISYIADTVVLVRFFEAQGRLRKAISILKHRGGAHEDAIRELRIDRQGIRVGQPLVDFRGVLTGTPEYFGARQPLMEERD
ncbi:ATPase domain-containing protein [Pseudomonas oryzihabitans]|uniref:ATPase domain-containing protein n=2 Tax=Gammaproteobacteria TaxID=1236 RepID=UPI00241C3FF9|nr:ATPase domain-containing protein [Pseudomonas oryzihabitans]